MRPHVDRQVSTAPEGFLAYFTNVWFLTGVQVLMVRERALVSIAFSTDLTGIRLLSCVDSQVGDQVRIGPKAFPTYSAGMRFFTGVQSHVELERTALFKTFPTCFANKRDLSCVDSHVDL